jgi:3-methylfumaryl-CoA hydratase
LTNTGCQQDIVYREDPTPGATPPRPLQANPWPDAETREITTNLTLLFRYSALTFNCHRIHYDGIRPVSARFQVF